MKALILAPFSHHALQELSKSLTISYESWTETRKLYDPHELAQRINDEDVRILVVEADFLFEEVFQEAEPLRLLGVCRNNLNHVDIEAATKHGVLVINTPGRNTQAVAEHTLGLMLALARRIPQAHRYVADGCWQQPVEPYISMRGVELYGKVLGIVGLGTIGRRVARLARAFGMQVLAYDPYVQGPMRGTAITHLEELLTKADFLSLHLPLTQETEGLIDAQRLSLMKPSAFVINTSEARIIEQTALAEALQEGRLAGAAMDVFDSHPISPQSPLLKLPNLILTPHIGGATDGTVERQSVMLMKDIQRFIRGVRPKNLVNTEVWQRRGR